MPRGALMTAVLAGIAVAILGCDEPVVGSAWDLTQSLSEPGPLDSAHRDLGLECGDCHTPIRGVEANACIACHALNGSLVQRQTTAFHADARACADCHVEHVAEIALRAPLDHDLLASLSSEWSDASSNSRNRADASSLDCYECHSNQDRHFALLGTDCLDCHGTNTWDVDAFTHPSPRSRDCAQCHQAPPSHYMKHFKMLSAKVARQPHAEVNECYTCHLTTSWPDIRGVGFYKHH